jgi:hypothetical protein
MDRAKVGRKELLEPCEQIITDRLVYLTEECANRGPAYAASHWNINGYLEGEIWFLFMLEVHVGRNAEQFVAVVHHGIGNHETIRVPVFNRDAYCSTECDSAQRDLVFVLSVDLVEDKEIQRPAIPSVVRLYRLDDFLSCIGKIVYFSDPVWVKSMALFVRGTCVVENGEPGPSSRATGREQGQLPRQMIEARTQIMRDVADEYADSHRRGTVNFQAVDAVACLRIYLDVRAIRLRIQKIPNLDVKRVKMFMCSGELCPWIVQGGQEK